MPLTKLHGNDIRRISETVRLVEGMPIVHPNEARMRRGIPASPFRRARVSGYGPEPAGHDYYLGYLIDRNGDDIGDEIEIRIQRGVPNTEADVRYYWPRLIANGAMATDLIVVSVTEAENGETVTHWYFVMGFGPWCEREAQPGVVPDLPSDIPQAPGEPIPPVSVLPVPPGGLPGTEPPPQPDELIARQRGGRPCDGCSEE